MQKRTVRTLFFSSMLVFTTLPNSVWAEDLPAEVPAKIQVVRVDGRIVITNAAPNAPIAISEPAPVAAPAFDSQMPADFQPLVNYYSNVHGVDPQLVAAVMKVESNYDRWAVSPKGARGLMQLIPATGKRFGVSDFYNPSQNIEGGVRYLKFLSDKFGASNVHLILAAYNAGENLVARVQRVPAIKETQDYVRKIQKIYKPGAALVSATETPKPAISEIQTAPTETPAPQPANKIYTTVDARGVIHFSNIGPPN
jgi:soluble lytic murein transglycosylase-like protein